MPYILNVWEDETRGLLTVHLYRANANHVIVMASVPEALDLLADMGETEVWSFDRAGNLGLCSLDPAALASDIGPDFPLPPVDFHEAGEPSKRSPGDFAPPKLVTYTGPPIPPAAPHRLRKRPFLHLLRG